VVSVHASRSVFSELINKRPAQEAGLLIQSKKSGHDLTALAHVQRGREGVDCRESRYDGRELAICRVERGTAESGGGVD